MLWANLKIALAVLIPFAAFFYARYLHFEDDCQQIERIVHSSSDVDWCLSHPRETRERGRVERQYLDALLKDLPSYR
jgi:hypothetical protein